MGLWPILYGAVGVVTAVTVMALTAPSADVSPAQQHQEAADSAIERGETEKAFVIRALRRELERTRVT